MRPSFHCASGWPPAAAYFSASTDDLASPARRSSMPARSACCALLNSLSGILSSVAGCVEPSRARAGVAQARNSARASPRWGADRIASVATLRRQPRSNAHALIPTPNAATLPALASRQRPRAETGAPLYDIDDDTLARGLWRNRGALKREIAPDPIGWGMLRN